MPCGTRTIPKTLAFIRAKNSYNNMRKEDINICLLLIISVILVSCKMNPKKSEFIYKNGETTLGTVYDKTALRTPKERKYFVKFDFNYNDSLLKNESFEVSMETYYEFMIGMKYEVRFLKSKPHINSIILLDSPIEKEYKNINNEIQRITRTYGPVPNKWYNNTGFERADILYHYSHISKIPYAKLMTYRNDSLVLSIPRGYYKYSKDSVGIHYLCNPATGKVIDTLRSFDLERKESDIFKTFNQGKADTVRLRKTREILVFKHSLTENYSGYKILIESWNPEWRCPGEERISIYKDTMNIKNYSLMQGVADYVIIDKELLILTSYSEKGRHLQRIPLDSLIYKLENKE